MPNVPGTSEKQASNPISEALGRLKVKGKLPPYGQYPIPETEQPVPQSVLTKAELHTTIEHVLKEIGKMLWYADPHVDFIPLTLDPLTENFVRLEGRWHSGIFVQGTFPILVQPPGLGQVTINLAPGWNALNVPEGTRLYSGDANRHPAWLGIANVPLAGTDIPALTLVPSTTVGLQAGPVGTVVGSVGLFSDYPAGSTPQNNSSGNVAAAVATATLTGVGGQFTYVTGFEITGSGATAGLPVIVTLTGCVGGTLTYIYSAAAGVLVENTPLIIEFLKPLKSSALAGNIVVSCPSLGTGNTNNAATIHGYTL